VSAEQRPEDLAEAMEAESDGDQSLAGLDQRWATVVAVVAVLLGCYIIAYVAGLLNVLGIRVYGAHRPIVYGGVLLLAFLILPARKGGRPRTRPPWYDLVLALVSAAACAYAVVAWEGFIFEGRQASPPVQMVAAITFAASLEAARRALGWTFAMIGAFFLAYPLLGSYFPGLLFTRQYSFERVAGTMYASEIGIFGITMNLFATVIAVFFLLAALIARSDAVTLLIDLGTAVTRNLRGGPAKLALVTSSLFGTISGVGAANVALTGSFTIPLMRQRGVPRHVAAAIEAAASSGGALVPPVMGAAAFIMADFLGVRFWTVVVAAIFPSILYYLALYVVVDGHAVRYQVKDFQPSRDVGVLEAFARNGHFLIPIAMLIWFLFDGVTPDRAALWSAGILVAVSWLRRASRLSPQRVLSGIEHGVLGFVRLAPAAGIIGILITSVEMTGLGVTLASGLVDLAAGNLIVLLLLVAAASLLLGMAGAPLLVYILMAVLLVPAIVALGVEPLAAHMFVLYFSVASLLTPPVGLSSLTAAGIAGASYWKTGLESMKLAFVAFVVPFMFVLEPGLLLAAEPAAIAYAVPTAALGTIALAVAACGYVLGRHLAWPLRVLATAGGFALLYPAWASDAVGVVLLAVGVAWLLLSRRRRERVDEHASSAG
jgi:TRAP transporter 4TM/12TM fusion protein